MIRFTLNGDIVEAEGERTLLSYLRGDALLTGAKNACGEGTCGACSVIVDGSLLTSCTIPLAKMAGKSIITVEGIERAEMDAYVRAFSDAGAVQCGFCTPGMVMSAIDMVKRYDYQLDEATVRRELEGNLCRCTGYHNIVKAILAAAPAMKSAGV